MDLLAKAITWTSNVAGSEEGKCMEELPPSLSCTHTVTCRTCHPATGMIPHCLAPSGCNRGRRGAVPPQQSWVGSSVHSLCSLMEPWVPLSSVLSLEHREWPCAVGHPLEMLLPGPFPSPSKAQPYCKFLYAYPGAEFPQKKKKENPLPQRATQTWVSLADGWEPTRLQKILGTTLLNFKICRRI